MGSWSSYESLELSKGWEDAETGVLVRPSCSSRLACGLGGRREQGPGYVAESFPGAQDLHEALSICEIPLRPLLCE